MRVSESRYTRDLRRINLAQRMIQHEVRTQWICAWAGISDERVRNLVKSYDQGRVGVARHRGPSPKVFTPLLRTSAMRSEASALAGLACALNLIPTSPIVNARSVLPGVELGERLIYTFELYKFVVPAAKLKMDHFILLVVSLAEGKELEVGHCSHCQAAVLRDHLGRARPECEMCRRHGRRQGARARANERVNIAVSEVPRARTRRSCEPQGDLFRGPGRDTHAVPCDDV